MYIAPELTPVITNKDPRWVGAWYFGWVVIAIVLFSFSIVMALFPKQLPRAAVRRKIAAEKDRRKFLGKPEEAKAAAEAQPVAEETSLRDLVVTFKRILTNKLFMLNNFAGIFYIFG